LRTRAAGGRSAQERARAPAAGEEGVNLVRRTRKRFRSELAVARVASAVAFASLGAFAIGSLAIAAIAIRRLAVGNARIDRLEIAELHVDRAVGLGPAPG
jgi:hypothetical protein